LRVLGVLQVDLWRSNIAQCKIPGGDMRDFIILTCPSCGGKSRITAETDRFACQYCGIENVVTRSGDIVSLAPLVEGPEKLQTGVDKTASELAIAQLRSEIADLEPEIENLVSWFRNENPDNNKLLRRGSHIEMLIKVLEDDLRDRKEAASLKGLSRQRQGRADLDTFERALEKLVALVETLRDKQAQIEKHKMAVAPISVAPTKESRKKPMLIVGALVAGLFLCVVLCVVVMGTGAVKALFERDDVEQAIDEWMRAMVRKDTDAAYTLLSTRAQRTASRSKLDDLAQGNNFAVFDGYKCVQVTTLNIGAAFQTNPDLPQGTVARVNGTITYEGGYTGRFEAVLEQENGEWRLFGINLTVPPDKMGE
jgi:hypothetical protein